MFCIYNGKRYKYKQLTSPAREKNRGKKQGKNVDKNSATRRPLAHGTPSEHLQGRPLVTYTVGYNWGRQGKGEPNPTSAMSTKEENIITVGTI